MYLDILIFAIIAAFLVYRLNAALGTRPGDEQPRPNPFAANDVQPRVIPMPKPAVMPKPAKPLIDPASDTEGRIETGLEEIAAANPSFNVNEFMAGARYAFETIVGAYSKGDRSGLQPLLSPKLYADFTAVIKAREDAGHTAETKIHRIKSAHITEAHLGGTMAYITIDLDVEQTAVTRDKTGAVVEGDPNLVSSVEDIWSFTRDVRSSDPNWVLMETRAAKK